MRALGPSGLRGSSDLAPPVSRSRFNHHADLSDAVRLRMAAQRPAPNGPERRRSRQVPSSAAAAAAILVATSRIDESPVLRPDRAASRGPTSRRASKVVPWATGMTRSVASSAESSLSAIPSAARVLSSAGGHQHDADPGGRQPPVDLAEQRLTEADVPLAEPDRCAEGHQQVTQFPRGTLPVVPGVAEEEVATLRVFPRLLLGLAGEVLDRSPLSGRVRDGPASTQPPRLPAAGRPATGRPTATAPGGPGRRGVVGGGAVVRPGSARRAVCGPAGCAMALDGCCATGHEPMLRRIYACPSTSAHRHERSSQPASATAKRAD